MPNPLFMVHPDTGKPLRRGSRKKIIEVPGYKPVSIEIPGWYPEDDSDSIHERADLLALEHMLRKAIGNG